MSESLKLEQAPRATLGAESELAAQTGQVAYVPFAGRTKFEIHASSGKLGLEAESVPVIVNNADQAILVLVVVELDDS